VLCATINVMKDKILSFLKNKFNIALIIIQGLAIICYFLGCLSVFFSAMLFVLEGVFFVVWGLKILIQIRNSRYTQEIFNQLPYDEAEKARILKQRNSINKNNKFIGISLIVLGAILIFSLFSFIF